MKETNNSVRGLYIHIPFCDRKCPYCAFYSIEYDPGRADRYLAALSKQLSVLDACPETIYVGGGTPSILSAGQLEYLCDAVRRFVSLEQTCEWTVEANPGSLNPDKLQTLVAAGVSRISLGAQSFDDETLTLLGRRHSVTDIRVSADMIRAAGIINLNLDLICCIPGAGSKAWIHTLEQAVSLKPRHISVYALTREEGTSLSEAAELRMLTDDEQLRQLDAAESALERAGYRRYEISNYAKPGFECLHNLQCWRGCEYIGLGPAASSHRGLERSTNIADVSLYIESVERGETPLCERDILTPQLKEMERVIFGLRMTEGIDCRLGVKCAMKMRQLQHEGLLSLANARWALTHEGRNLADYIGVELLCSVEG